MEEERPPATVFRNNPEGQWGDGRPKARWIDGVQADLRTLRVMNSQQKAQDREIWNGILNQAKTHKWL